MYFSRLLCCLKFSVTFGCSNYGKYSLHIKHANISIFKLHEYVYVLRYIKKSWMSQFSKEEKWLHHYIKFSIKSKWKVTSWIDFYLTQLKTLYLCGWNPNIFTSFQWIGKTNSWCSEVMKIIESSTGGVAYNIRRATCRLWGTESQNY